MASILLHCCCGPCATYTIENLREQSFEVNALWYNPNIHPFTEHQRRFESMQSLAKIKEVPLIIDEGYQMINYLRTVAGNEENRCTDCYYMRLNRAAEIAHSQRFDTFTTTLLISPYQNQDLIEEVGKHAAKKNGVEFYFQDFRAGFQQSRQMAKDLDLYRQKYCGCIYSEWERYAKVKVNHQ